MDDFNGSYHRSLVPGARAAISDVLAVKKEERILIIANPGKDPRSVSEAIFDAALEAKAVPVLVFQREKGSFDFAEEEVIKAISTKPDIILSISKDRLGKDRFGLKHGYRGKRRYDHLYDYLYEEKKMRGFWSPGVTCSMFSRTVPIDYSQMRSDAAKIFRLLSSAESVRVTAPGGTDISIGLRGRKPRKDDGDFRMMGEAGNIPSGEVYVSPALGTANGVIAFDGSIVLNEGEVVIKKPILTEVRSGYISKISGGNEADKLEASVKEGEKKARDGARKGEIKQNLAEKYAKNAWSIGELGIGLNRKARIIANMLEDEKVYGTCHFAVGTNYDGDADALIHLDGLVKSPTLTVKLRSGKERPLMHRGRLAWD